MDCPEGIDPGQWKAYQVEQFLKFQRERIQVPPIGNTTGQSTSVAIGSELGVTGSSSGSNPIVTTGIESKTHQEIEEEEEEEEEEKNEETGDLFADLVNFVAKTDSEDQQGKLSKETSPLTKGKEDSNVHY